MAEDEVKESKNFINLGVVRNEKGEVLMARRREKKVGSDGSVLEWIFPGGAQRYSESREECVKRRVLSMTGYNVTPVRQISMHVNPIFMKTLNYYLCQLDSPEPIAEPKEMHEIAEIKWVKPEEIRNLITTDLDPKVAKALGIG